MKYLTVSEVAKLWQKSERTVRNYCNQGRIVGAKLTGKVWLIPENAKKPERKNAIKRNLLDYLQEEKVTQIKGGIYHKIQIELTYNSNHMEGSMLTHDQTRYIFETNTIGIDSQAINVDDIVETANHFKCVDIVIEQANHPLSEAFIKTLHHTLKNGTNDSRKDWFNVGEYKKLPNEVGGQETTLPENVVSEMKILLKNYNQKKEKTFEELLEFHYNFEILHPFQDGNGRVGRLILFKECLRNNIVPFIIDEKLKLFYYRGLKEWKHERGYLLDTCLSVQDKFKQYLDYFRIGYDEE